MPTPTTRGLTPIVPSVAWRHSTHTLTAVNNTSFGPTGLPVINSTITIVGNGSTITRETLAPDFRILAVGSGGDLTLQETTVSGGRATGSSFDPQRGGGLLNKGSLSLVGSIVFANLALAEGGGVNNGSFVTLRLINSTISGNSATIGGGLSNSQGTVTMMNSTVSGNTAEYSGGGVWFYSDDGTLLMTNSTVSGNTANGNGAGGYGGGVATMLYGEEDVVLDSHCTITGNSAPRTARAAGSTTTTTRKSSCAGPDRRGQQTRELGSGR